jgi:6-phosphogluconolactonase (cycloisomerase 2 family)
LIIQIHFILLQKKSMANSRNFVLSGFVVLSLIVVSAVYALHLTDRAVLNPDVCETSSFTLFMLVGTYTTGTSTGVYVYKFDQETGVAEYVSVAEAVNPSYLTVSANERFVYAAGESGRDAAVAYAFSFDKQAGKLTLLNSQPTNGASPCYINTDHSGRFVVTANYTGGNVSFFPLSPDGSLQPVDKVFEFKEGDDPDATRPIRHNLHCTVFSPDRQFLFAADLGADKLHKFTVNEAAPFLTVGTPDCYKLEQGSGPRHLTFHPNGKFAYLINELSGKVTAFNYANGHLEPVQYIASDTSEGARKGSADIHVSPDGKFLYASNRANTNNIAIFRINEADGQLTLVGHQPTGQHPRNFIITPNGKFLLVANMNNSLIQVFERDTTTGLLNEDTSKQITEIDRPVCLKFVGIE